MQVRKVYLQKVRCFARCGTILYNLTWKTPLKECLFRVTIVKLQALTCNFTNSKTSPWVFFTFLKLFLCFLYRCVGGIYIPDIDLLSAHPTKWSNILKQFLGKLSTNFWSVFHQFVGLALKGLNCNSHFQRHTIPFGTARVTQFNTQVAV